MRLIHAGTRPLAFSLWGCSFYDDTLDVKKTDAATVHLINSRTVGSNLGGVATPENAPPQAIEKLAVALDDLRLLGEIDLRLNHPVAGVVKP
ncbi:MAG: hypothetical protein NTW19_09510 [Planctomycetota bacterium]|nr:hypothetical protein [Planctomycetota bacterium]